MKPLDYYKGSQSWVPDRTIYFVRHGSHAYGTSTPTSDLDLRGVCVAPKKYYLGLPRFEQYTQTEGVDLVIFDIKKFMHLGVQCNPNVLELLYVDDSDILDITPQGQLLRDSRDLFLSRKAKATFSGYAFSELKKVKRHREWLLNPPKKVPERVDFGLPERGLMPKNQLEAATAAVQKQLDEWSLKFLDELEPATRISTLNRISDYLASIKVSMDDNVWIGAARLVGLHDNVIEVMDKERRYNAAKKTWDSYQDWLKNRNPARAALEEKYGFDGKNASHLVRLLKMAREILTEGKVIVKRPDAAELLGIRNGSMTYDQIIEYAETENNALQGLAQSSPLPAVPNEKAVNALCIKIIESML